MAASVGTAVVTGLVVGAFVIGHGRGQTDNLASTSSSVAAEAEQHAHDACLRFERTYRGYDIANPSNNPTRAEIAANDEVARGELTLAVTQDARWAPLLEAVERVSAGHQGGDATGNYDTFQRYWPVVESQCAVAKAPVGSPAPQAG